MALHHRSDEHATPRVLPPATGRRETAADPGRPATRERIRTLVGLLEDDSPAVLEVVRDELLRQGHLARPGLRKGLEATSPRLRARTRTILSELDRRDVMRRLIRHAVRPEIDLERALFLLGRLENPRLDSRPYERALDAMGEEVSRRAASEAQPLARVMVLAQYLGNELGYIGSEIDYAHRDNIHLHRAIERKRGMPLTLTAIYMFVARRSGIRASALPLPGHVLLRVRDGRRALIVDPFHGGRIRTRDDCVRYLAEHSLVASPQWFHDATDRALFQRQVLNLMNSCQLRGFSRQAADLHRLALILGREPARDAIGQTS